VVPHENDGTPFPDKTQACGRRGPIPHDITEAEDFIDPLGINIHKHGIQSVYVGMYVRDKGDSGHAMKRGVNQALGN
jgi:hypothetical protein